MSVSLIPIGPRAPVGTPVRYVTRFGDHDTHVSDGSRTDEFIRLDGFTFPVPLAQVFFRPGSVTSELYEASGLYARYIQESRGKELDRVAAVFGVTREPAIVFGRRMPWGQLDSTLRGRAWIAALNTFRNKP